MLKSLISIAAKGKPAALKEMSDWLINRLGETESARVKLKVLRLMMLVMSSKKGGKFKAQLRQDGEAILRATTAFETAPDPEHGEKPMLFVRKSAVKCLMLLDLPTTAQAPAAEAPAPAAVTPGSDLEARKKALEERKAALSTAAAAAAPAAAAAAPKPAPVAKAPVAAPVVAKAPVAVPVAVKAPAAAVPAAAAASAPAAPSAASSDIDALVAARVDAAMAGVTQRMDKLERVVEEKVAEVRREALANSERLAAAEQELAERLDKVEVADRGGESFAQLEQKLRETIDEAAKVMVDGGEGGLAVLQGARLDEMSTRLNAAEATSVGAGVKSVTLAGMVLQLRKRANATEEDGLRLHHSIEQLEERLEGAQVSAVTASADSVGQEALQAQLLAVDEKFTAASTATAAWLEEQLASVTASISNVELSVQITALDVESKALDAADAAVSTAVSGLQARIAQTESGLEASVSEVDERIIMVEEGMDAGIG